MELMDLQIEKMVKKNDGMLVTQCRLKQRSDKQETKFLVPNNGPVNFAAVIDDYLNVIKSSLGHFTSRVLFKGIPAAYADRFMGKNLVGKVPCESSTVLGLDNFFYISFSTTLYRHSSIIIQQSSVKSMADKLQGPSNQVEKTEISKVSIENIEKCSSASPPQSRKPCMIQNADKIAIIENFHGNNFTNPKKNDVK